MTHQSVEGSDAAVPADFVRLSCGIEAPEDLVDDLRLAFESVAESVSGDAAQRSAAGQAMR
jgi:cystathionine gamma-synthase